MISDGRILQISTKRQIGNAGVTKNAGTTADEGSAGKFEISSFLCGLLCSHFLLFALDQV